MKLLSRWDRRRFLQAAGIGAAATALYPFFPTPVAEAGGAPAPRRLVLFMSPMASNLAEWRANGSAEPFRAGAALPTTLAGRILNPLDGLQSKLVWLDGVDVATAYLPREARGMGLCSTGHNALVSLWTNTQPVALGPVEPTTTCSSEYGGASGPSLDQLVHQRQRADAPHLRSFQLGSWDSYPGQRDGRALSSYGFPTGDGPAPQLFPLSNPRAAFDHVFSGLGSSGAVADRRRLERRQVLGLVRGEMDRLRAELPTEDRLRLEQHHQSIRDLETRLDAAPVCMAPDAPASRDRGYINTHPTEIAALMYEMIRLSFECDLTRSVSFCLGQETQGGNVDWWDPALPDGVHLHTISHETHVAENREYMRRFNEIQMESFARLIRTLETGSNVMEDTIVALGSPMSDSSTHTNRNAPFILAAGANTPIRTNRYLRYGEFSGAGTRFAGGIPHARVLHTLAHAMDMPDMEPIGDRRIDSFDPIAEVLS